MKQNITLHCPDGKLLNRQTLGYDTGTNKIYNSISVQRCVKSPFKYLKVSFVHQAVNYKMP